MGQISHCIQRNIYCNVTCRRLLSVVVFAIALYSCVVELSIIYGAPFVSKILWHSMDKNRFDLYKIDSMCCLFQKSYGTAWIKSTRCLQNRFNA